MVLPLTTSLCFDSPSVILQRMQIINHKSKSWFISFIVISDYEIPLRERTPSRPCLATKSWPRNSVGSSVQPHVVSGRHVFEYRRSLNLSTLLDRFFTFFNRSSSARAGYFFTFIKSLLKPSMELLPLKTISSSANQCGTKCWWLIMIVHID